jgi:cyclopropane-fatty-acyl-phospholipid synthase
MAWLHVTGEGLKLMSKNSKFTSVEKWLLRKVQNSIGRAPIQLSLGDAENSTASGTPPVAKVIIRDRWTLAKLIINPELAFGDAFSEGRIEVEGDLIALLENVSATSRDSKISNWYTRLVARIAGLTESNSRRQARKNIHHHYDIRTDFYQLWLDPQLVYTCAYFPTPSATLEEAQFAKLDYVCRKLQLRPGENVVEAGCGWGALALHMAKYYGVNVRAFNISHEQITFARERAKSEGLNHQVEFVEDDYRNISGQCDAFASVGMLEHLGVNNYRGLGRIIDKVLGPSGRGLIHFIGRNQPRPFNAWMKKRIFPGAYIPALREALRVFDPGDFSVVDVENLRLHYAKTLEHWLDRYDRSRARVTEMFDTKFLRAWRLYLAGSAAGFRAGRLQLFQILFARPAWQKMPSTRAYLYPEEASVEQEKKWFHAMS